MATSSPPPLNIPRSTSTVKVHIIDSTARIKGIPIKMFMTPEYKGLDYLNCPAFAFLIEHVATGRKILFDLGVNPNWENGPKVIVDRIKGNGWDVTVEKGVADILREGGVDPKDIEAIIWSHHHWDHTGDPSTFPSTTALIVGPSLPATFLSAGYPTDPNSPILESAYQNRTLRELSFTDSESPNHLLLGKYPAIDYFGDGAFYLLDTPGHSVGHVCALARTTAGAGAEGEGEGEGGEGGSFVFLGGDIAHHGAEVRPTEWLRMPEVVGAESVGRGGYPGSVFERVHRLGRGGGPCTEPFCLACEDAAHDVEKARESVRRLAEFDAHPSILLLLAHDATLLDVVDTFPHGTANSWMEKGWKEKCLWRFLGDLGEAVGQGEGA